MHEAHHAPGRTTGRGTTGTGVDLSAERGLRAAWTAHADELFAYAARALGDRHAAEEAVQETFVRAWRAAGRYDGARALRPWLFAILRNVVVDAARSRAVRAVPMEISDRPDADGRDPLDANVDSWLVEEALRRIRPDHRAILVETYLRGRPYADVARSLDIPEGTARSRAFYGLRALRLALQEMGWES